MTSAFHKICRHPVCYTLAIFFLFKNFLELYPFNHLNQARGQNLKQVLINGRLAGFQTLILRSYARTVTATILRILKLTLCLGRVYNKSMKRFDPSFIFFIGCNLSVNNFANGAIVNLTTLYKPIRFYKDNCSFFNTKDQTTYKN